MVVTVTPPLRATDSANVVKLARFLPDTIVDFGRDEIITINSGWPVIIYKVRPRAQIYLRYFEQSCTTGVLQVQTDPPWSVDFVAWGSALR